MRAELLLSACTRSAQSSTCPYWCFSGASTCRSAPACVSRVTRSRTTAWERYVRARRSWTVPGESVGISANPRDSSLESQCRLFGVATISQRSLHNVPIFRLLLKVAVHGAHHLDCPNVSRPGRNRLGGIVLDCAFPAGSRMFCAQAKSRRSRSSTRQGRITMAPRTRTTLTR